jgi:hypothetical protein
MDLHCLKDPFRQAALGACLQEQQLVTSEAEEGRLAVAFPGLRQRALNRSYEHAKHVFNKQPTQEGLLALAARYGRLLYWDMQGGSGLPTSWNTSSLAEGWAELRTLILEREIGAEFADLLGEWEDDAHLREP